MREHDYAPGHGRNNAAFTLEDTKNIRRLLQTIASVHGLNMPGRLPGEIFDNCCAVGVSLVRCFSIFYYVAGVLLLVMIGIIFSFLITVPTLAGFKDSSGLQLVILPCDYTITKLHAD